MKIITRCTVLAAFLLATPAFAQQPPPPPGGPDDQPMSREMPPRGGPRGPGRMGPPPPPPKNASFEFENKGLKYKVRCSEDESMKECVEAAAMFLDKIKGNKED